MSGTIFVKSLADVNTGGPEALIQLSLALWNNGYAVKVFPYHKLAHRFSIEYPTFRSIPVAHENTTYRSIDVVILPEIDMNRCSAFGYASVLIWLLTDSKIKKGSKCSWVAHNSYIGDKHGIPVMRPYITPSTVKYCQHMRTLSRNESLILVDNDTPMYVVQQIQQWNGTVIIPKGMHRNAIRNLISRAFMVVDWSFVGSERLPLESMLCGAFIVTSKYPTHCGHGRDFHLPNESFVSRPRDILALKKPFPNMTRSIEAFERLNEYTLFSDASRVLNATGPLKNYFLGDVTFARE